ncbi:hypothetical protein RRG08_043046 [Elysia crispata]|uniref:G-protein coupled receptors family 1 profile domain-containing protein n=1 Tax=Elysia crispata TaxID=231223 RepID=A0AAE0XZ21_9GAST|nr:hypothetical protein RRG08_043046 [Elysia crispata]
MDLPSAEDSVGNFSFFYSWPGISAYDQMIFTVSNVLLNLTMAIYGFAVVANTAIISVFLKDGFKSTSNISFFALAIADLLVSVIWFPWLMAFHHILYKYMSFFWIEMFNEFLLPCAEAIRSIGSLITAIISLERLCCIMFPLKVKQIFTRKSVVWLIMAALVYEMIAMSTFVAGVYLQRKAFLLYSQRNTTVFSGDLPPDFFLGTEISGYAAVAGFFGPNYVLYVIRDGPSRPAKLSHRKKHDWMKSSIAEYVDGSLTTHAFLRRICNASLPRTNLH